MAGVMPNEGEQRPAGYAALIEQYGLDVIPNWHQSIVSQAGGHRIGTDGNAMTEVYPAAYWPGDTPGDHLEFALKYDGTNLALLTALFHKVSEEEVLDFVRRKPTGKYARRLWFLYEFLTGRTLPLADLEQGNYIDLLDAEQYYTSGASHRIRRQRVNENLLGNRSFCPTVRRTSVLHGYEEANFPERCQAVMSGHSPALLRRALDYLYTKETKSSFAIERIQPTSTRTQRFVALLQLAEKEDFCEKKRLIELQNRIVDGRFCDTDYRSSQNYIGETLEWRKEMVHFVAPKPEDLPDLMDGWVTAHHRMEDGEVPAAIHAAAVAYGLVFLHPFEDGNGRIHRFLLHNILARRGFTPEGFMFPVSAAMLKNPADYDASLEAFSRPLMPLVEYSLDEAGRMTVHNDTAPWYRYIDLTSQAESLFRFIEQTILTEVPDELTFLANYDATKDALRQIVDMPDRKLDLAIRFCLQNHGQLSRRKRAQHFSFLSDDEVERIEQAVEATWGKGPSAPDTSG